MKDTACRLRETVRELCETIGPRAPGSVAERQASVYLQAQFQKLGLPTAIESFESASHEASHATLHSEAGDAFACLPAQFSQPGKARAELLFLPGFEASHSLRINPSNRIALILPTGDHPSRLKSLVNLQRRGLSAAIIVSPHIDNLDSKIVRYPEVRIPVVCVSFRTACKLRTLQRQPVRLVVTASRQRTPGSCNVVATLRGQTSRWLAVCSHIDTAAGTPGAVDNAGGAALTLELARRLRKTRPRASILFLLTGSEEYGDINGCGRGAMAFFQRRVGELHNAIGLVNTDGLGSLLPAPRLHVNGPRAFREAVIDPSFERTYAIPGPAGTHCDHGAAEQFGLPYAWFTDLGTGNHPHMHTPDDTLEFLDLDGLAGYLPDIERTVRRLARIPPPLPFIRDGGMLIRPARYTDIPSILEITRLAFASVAIAGIQQTFFGAPLGGREWHEHKNLTLERKIRDHFLQVIVAELDRRIVGYATYSFDTDTGIAEIGNNAVLPAYQRRGIGLGLQKEVNRRMEEEGCRRFAVRTLSCDTSAQRLYEKLGYTRVAETIHYLRRKPAPR